MKERVSWTIEEEIIKRVEKESKEYDRSSSWIVNEILDNYFRNKSKQEVKK